MDIVIGIMIGMCLAALMIYLYVRGLVKNVESEIMQVLAMARERLLPIIVERVDGTIYCYSKADNQFICQGTTAEEISQAFKARFPERVAVIAGGDDGLVNELSQQLGQVQ